MRAVARPRHIARTVPTGRALDRPQDEAAGLGVNLLGFEPSEAFGYLHESGAYEVCGVWCDGAPGRMRKEPGQHGVWAALWFGGVAFKYQRPTSDLDAEALDRLRRRLTLPPVEPLPSDPLPAA